jgi:tetraacyldisaccharide 4'-kinase
MLRSHHLGVPTVSVGNLTVGGTGKSPFIRTVIDCLVNHRPAMVLARGYGPKIECDGRRLNDEGHELARARPETMIAQGADRVTAAWEAMKDRTPAVIILDDGAQHLRIRRDFDIVLLDAESLLHSAFCLPSGPWRESLATVAEFDCAIITRSNRIDPDALDRVRRRIAGFLPDDRILTAVHRPTALRTNAGESVPMERLAGERVAIFSAIAGPDDFARAVRDLGGDIVLEQRLSDHEVPTVGDLDRIERRRAESGAAFLLTTGKDSPKIDRPHHVLEIEVDLEGDLPRFKALLEAGLVAAAGHH